MKTFLLLPTCFLLVTAAAASDFNDLKNAETDYDDSSETSFVNAAAASDFYDSINEEIDSDESSKTSSANANTTEKDSTTTKLPSRARLSSFPDICVTVGTRVVRGRDWDSGDEDGGKGGKGTIIKIGVNEKPDWARVRWDTGKTNNYRMGWNGNFDLSLDSEYFQYLETTGKPSTKAEPELAALMTVGARVVRGRDWDWGDQDGGAGRQGTVIVTNVCQGWVKVRWDTGKINLYRLGSHEKYDLRLADDYSPLGSKVDITTIITPSTWKTEMTTPEGTTTESIATKTTTKALRASPDLKTDTVQESNGNQKSE